MTGRGADVSTLAAEAGSARAWKYDAAGSEPKVTEPQRDSNPVTPTLTESKQLINLMFFTLRGVAQSGSARALGACRRFFTVSFQKR